MDGVCLSGISYIDLQSFFDFPVELQLLVEKCGIVLHRYQRQECLESVLHVSAKSEVELRSSSKAFRLDIDLYDLVPNGHEGCVREIGA